MKERKSSYRQIMKATSLFGGVQVFMIFISIIRSKVIAILLGPAGMGVAGLLTSTTGLVKALTNFGLGTSAVRNVAAANESGDIVRISKVVKTFRKLVWITGLLGLLITMAFSSWFSIITFGNEDYSSAFIWLSFTLLFSQLTSGQNVLLQGMRKLSFLAKANLIGSFVGLIVSVPIYYYWRIDGIVPALIITSILSFVIAGYFARKVKVENIEVSRAETTSISKDMLRMGIMLSLSSLMALGAAFVIRIYISKTGGVEDVGLYTAGLAIVTTYVGLVFTAMGKDFYPRLSGVAHDNTMSETLITEQAEIGLLILSPILTVFLVFINWIIVILYSSKFISIEGMMHWAALGMYFKVVSWCLAYLLIAKGATKIYFWTELIANAYTLAIGVLSYSFFGLEGLGISYMLGYILYLIHVYFIIHHKYDFSFKNKFLKLFGIQLILGLCCFLIVRLSHNPWTFIMGSIIIIVSGYYSIYELDKRLELKVMLNEYLKNK